MATPITRIQEVLEKEFAHREIELKRTKNGRVTGWITSDSFDGQSEIERMQRIWRVLNAYLRPEDRSRISAIWPITKLERKVLLEDEE